MRFGASQRIIAPAGGLRTPADMTHLGTLLLDQSAYTTLVTLHPLLLPDLPAPAAEALLSSAGFDDVRAALHRLRHLAGDDAALPLFSDCLPHLLAALADAAHPDQTLVSFERLLQDGQNGAAARQSLLAHLAVNPRAIQMLTTLFAGSQFLTEILLRQPDAALRLFQSQREGELGRRKTVAQFRAEAAELLAANEDWLPGLDALRRYQRWQLLRIGACDFFGLMDLSGITAQLSRLADGLVQACLDLAAGQTGVGAADFVVLAMGKLGGGEVNYSSDIGFLYRVDMRLRPWGRDGALVTELDGHLDYLRRHARLWEKQALLKARPIAGAIQVGLDFLEQAQPIIFDLEPERVREDVRAMKERTESYLRQHGRSWGEVKLGEGSIRDAEFVVQYLQLSHGGRDPYVRSGRTLDALSRLSGAGVIAPDAHRTLGAGYVFLRTVEHHLQLMHYRQTSTLPTDPAELEALARRLGFSGAEAGERFLQRYQQHRDAVRAVYLHYLGADPMAATATPAAAVQALPPANESGLAVQRHLERMDASYAAVFSPDEIRRHAILAGQVDEANPVQVDVAALDDGHWRVTIVGYDYLGELSLICGLLFVYGLDIASGHIFTYEPLPAAETPELARRSAPAAQRQRPAADTRQKIVDVFTVRPVEGALAPDLWQRYAEELADLVRKLHFRRRDEVQGALTHRVAAVLQQREGGSPTVYPVDITIDNESSPRYTLLEIAGPDTPGFLYELTNALALNGVYIARVEVNSIRNEVSSGSRVQDTLFVVDANGQKMTAGIRQRELRAAIALVKHFTHLLPLSPNPERALLHFRSFLAQLFERPNWPDELVSVERPEVLNALARLLGVSDFLWNDFLRMQYANLFPVVSNVGGLEEPHSKELLAARLRDEVAAAPDVETRWQVINAFKDREMFRIDMRHILGHTVKFGTFARELTALAEVVVGAAYTLCEIGLVGQYGLPRLEDGSPCPLSIVALGKAGGHELGFASDIELMFIYAGAGRSGGANSITTSEFYEKLVQEFVRGIRAKHEGIFEIDLQLRPYGKAGSMAVSLDAFRRYFGPGGPAWAYERQALVKLRPIAGDPGLGRQITALRDDFIFTGDDFDVAAMRAMRERQLRHLVAAGVINAKFSPGCLVDIEYLVQALQITHGRQHPGLRLPNTREAMTALRDLGLLASDDFSRLRQAHIFFRNLINALRMVRGHAKDLSVPPAGSDEFAFLARRLGESEQNLSENIARHAAAVQQISNRVLDALAGEDG
jgi:glutamate-ammonia-ligase adenylyltransferase